jgi:hypothetical protein
VESGSRLLNFPAIQYEWLFHGYKEYNLLDLNAWGDFDVSVVGNTLDTMVGVQVLMENNLENGGTALTRSNDGRGQEVRPDTEPAFSIFLDNLILVGEPVLVPTPESSRVVDTKNINVLDFKSDRLDLVDNPTKGATCIGTREDILVHEQTPDEILILPRGTEASNLKDEDTIVIEEVIDLAHERVVATNTDML